MKLSFLLIILLTLFLDCQNSKSKGTDTTLLGALLLASRPASTSTTTTTPPPTGDGTTTQTLTVSSVTRSSSTPIISGDSVSFTINVRYCINYNIGS